MMVVSKDCKGEGKRETVSGERTEGKEKVEEAVFFLSPLKIQAPFL